MIKYFMSLITKENIILVAAVIGAIIAIINIVMMKKRLVFHSVRNIYNTDGGFFFYITISNKSRLPLSITQILISEDGRKYIKCFQGPTVYSETRNDDGTVERHNIQGLQLDKFPIALGSLEARTVYIGAPRPTVNDLVSPKVLTIIAETIRGKIKSRPLSL